MFILLSDVTELDLFRLSLNLVEKKQLYIFCFVNKSSHKSSSIYYLSYIRMISVGLQLDWNGKNTIRMNQVSNTACHVRARISIGGRLCDLASTCSASDRHVTESCVWRLGHLIQLIFLGRLQTRSPQSLDLEGRYVGVYNKIVSCMHS